VSTTSHRAGQALLAVVALVVAMIAVALAPSKAAAATPRPLLRSVVDFGCANPANRLAEHLLPKARAAGGKVACFGAVRATAGARGPAVMAGPVGLKPADIQSAYKLSGLHANGRTVAIVDAFDDPKAEADLAVYRKQFGLTACTTANGCFKKVNQAGAASPLPKGDYGWAEEITLDLDAVWQTRQTAGEPERRRAG